MTTPRTSPATPKATPNSKCTCTPPMRSWSCAFPCRRVLTTWASRSLAASGHPKACCSRHKPASGAPRTSITTAIRRWSSCRLAGRTARLGKGRLAEPPQGVPLPSQRRARRKSRAPKISCRPSARVPIGVPSAIPNHDAVGFLSGGPQGRRLRRRDPTRARAHPRVSQLPVSHRTPARGIAAGSAYRARRSRAGLAAVVLPLGQHSRRRAADVAAIAAS